MEVMKITKEADITEIIESDTWMMDTLRAAESLELNDWWIGAGFLRNKIWNSISNKDSTPTRDVDLVYFNDQDTKPETDWQYDEYMKTNYPFAEWEVRNQARMHYVNGFEPYKSTAEGISNWVETATCVGVRLTSGKLEYLFCHGTDDLFGLIARPIPRFQTSELIGVFHGRIEKKAWKEKWPSIRVFDK